MADTVRTTLSLRKSDVKNLDEVADAAELNRNDAIRKALASEAFIQRVLKGGGKILIEEPDGKIKEVAWVS